MASSVKWQLDYSGQRSPGAAEWAVESAVARQLRDLVGQLLRADGIDELPHERLASVLPALRGRHSLRLRLSGTDTAAARALCVKAALRKPSSIVRWESPISSSQRSEGLLYVHTPGVEDGTLYRVPPPDLQGFIASAVRLTVDGGTASHPGRCLAPGQPSTGVYALAQRDLPPYEKLTAALVAQRDRAAGGGEPWSIHEQLRKLATLQTLALSLSHKVEHGGGRSLSDEEASVFTALAEGRAALEDGAERARVGADDGEPAGSSAGQCITLSQAQAVMAEVAADTAAAASASAAAVAAAQQPEGLGRGHPHACGRPAGHAHHHHGS